MTSTALRHWSLDWKQTLAVREEEKKRVPTPWSRFPVPFPSLPSDANASQSQQRVQKGTSVQWRACTHISFPGTSIAVHMHDFG